jgi:hypothetical protein
MEETPEVEWWFIVAEAIGGMTVAELKRRMSGLEFVEWQVYLRRKQDRERQAAGG